MKKWFGIFMAAALSLSLFACNAKNEEETGMELAEIIPQNTVSASLNAEGKTVDFDESNIDLLMDVLKTIEVHEAEEEEAEAPGSMSVTVKLQSEDEVTITLPYLYYDGKAYCADAECIEEFGKLLEE